MRKLAWDSSFRRAFKRQTRRDRIFDVLDQLARDPFLPTLKTHKLSGQLQGAVGMLGGVRLPHHLCFRGGAANR